MESELVEESTGVGTDEGPCRRYSLQQLAEIANVTRQRVRSWVRAGLLAPTEADGAEAFTFHDARTACLLLKLSQNGMGTARLKTILVQLRRRYPDARKALSQLDLFAGLLVIRDDASRLTSPNGQLLIDLTDEAETISTIALRLSQSDADEAFESAAALEQAGDLEEAARAYWAYLSQFGPEVAACFNLANVLAALGKTEAAVERYRQAVEIDPQYAAAWSNLGNAVATLGEVDEALDAWRRAVEIDPDLTEAVYNLADGLQQAKRFGEARSFWEAYLERDRDSEWADYARACLGSSVA
jgi:tetratricopeptide (TPR) repeat protein